MHVGKAKAQVGKCRSFPASLACSPTRLAFASDNFRLLGSVVAELQNRETGTFAGDEWGEEDTRFLFCGLIALSLLNLLDLVDVDKTAEHIASCANFDGGYGAHPGAESHAAQIYTCVGALSILGKKDLVDTERLSRWLSERQVPGGGLNGRPEKKEDVLLQLVGAEQPWHPRKDATGSTVTRSSASSCRARTRRMAASPTALEIWWMSSTPSLASPG